MDFELIILEETLLDSDIETVTENLKGFINKVKNSFGKISNLIKKQTKSIKNMLDVNGTGSVVEIDVINFNKYAGIDEEFKKLFKVMDKIFYSIIQSEFKQEDIDYINKELDYITGISEEMEKPFFIKRKVKCTRAQLELVLSNYQNELNIIQKQIDSCIEWEEKTVKFLMSKATHINDSNRSQATALINRIVSGDMLAHFNRQVKVIEKCLNSMKKVHIPLKESLLEQCLNLV